MVIHLIFPEKNIIDSYVTSTGTSFSGTSWYHDDDTRVVAYFLIYSFIIYCYNEWEDCGL